MFTSENVATLVVSKISDIRNILIPICEEFPLNDLKHLDYLDFKEARLKMVDYYKDKNNHVR